MQASPPRTERDTYMSGSLSSMPPTLMKLSPPQ